MNQVFRDVSLTTPRLLSTPYLGDEEKHPQHVGTHPCRPDHLPLY